MKKLLLALAVLLAGVVVFVLLNAMAFDASFDKVYDIPIPAIKASQDPAVIARGKHLADSLGGCTDCHTEDLGGRLVADLGPLGEMHTPNISDMSQWSDGEIARLVRDGLKRDGRAVRFMPIGDFHWWPDEDITALVSWLRTVTPVDRASTSSHYTAIAKVLDRRDLIVIDAVRRIDLNAPRPQAPPPAPSAAYGKFVANMCLGCHGANFSGGKIPGAPPDMAVPTNLTPHETGLGAYSEADFYETITTGVRPNGTKLNEMMPVAILAAMNDVERKALWEFFRTLPPKPFGNR